MQSKKYHFKMHSKKLWELINQKSSGNASAVVKADAYGFGMKEVSKALMKKVVIFSMLHNYKKL